MSLSTHVTERLKITSNSKPLNKTKPESKDELQALIFNELKKQGPDANLNFIDTSEITDMSWLFLNLHIGNIRIDEWDTSNVTNMSYMFYNCENFNADLSCWDTSKVTNMGTMFYGCNVFEGSGLDNWNVSKVTKMDAMFNYCYKFDSDLSRWNVSKVVIMERMFSKCSIFRGTGLDKWGPRVSKVANMNYMFSECPKLKCDLSGWNVAKVKRRVDVFYDSPNMLDNPHLQPKFN
jgi:surface protein